jgi:hypothetical protein
VRFEVPGVPPPTALEAWAITTGTREDPGLDDDGDGWTNVAEFYLGMRPQVPDQPPFQPKVVLRDGRRHFAMEFRRLHGVEAPLQVGVEVSRDLLTWTDGSDLVDWIASAPDPDGTQAVEVVQKSELDHTEWYFMRLRVAEASSP